MGYFVKPSGIGSEGYDADNARGSGSLWRLRLPKGGMRQLALVDGTDLIVRSGNTNAIPDLVEEYGRSPRTFRVVGQDIGGSWLGAYDQAGNLQFQIQAWVDDPAKFQKEVNRKSTVETNLGLSMQAVNYVLKKVGVQAANYDKYQGQACFEKGTAPKNKLDICLYDKVRPEASEELSHTADATELDNMRIYADKAIKHKCGNCGENADIAFMYLYNMGVRPLDRVEHSNDHNFVVIGRRDGDINDTTSWGPDAVICDPWMQGLKGKGTGSYPVSRLEDVQGIKRRKLKLMLHYRAV